MGEDEFPRGKFYTLNIISTCASIHVLHGSDPESRCLHCKFKTLWAKIFLKLQTYIFRKSLGAAETSRGC